MSDSTAPVKSEVVYLDVDGNEVARVAKKAGRPPIGPNVTKDEDGNIFISEVLTDKPANLSQHRAVEVDGKVLYVPRNTPISSVSRKYVYDKATGELTDEGPKGRGRSSKDYEKVEDSKVLNGVELQGHWLKVVDTVSDSATEADTEIEVESSVEEVVPV